MKEFINTFIQIDGYTFLLIGFIVLIIPSPQPGLTKKVNEEDLLPFSQTRRLLASMFIASALLLIIIGRNLVDYEILRQICIVRVASFLLVIGLNASQYKSKRWKPAPLITLMTIFSLIDMMQKYFLNL